jgi:ParB family transcriptional regulator, chromosome partitioning protein
MKRQALGKGLSSLIPEAPAAQSEAGFLLLDVDRIAPSPFQPRTDFTGLEGLVESIRENGIVQPVVVRQEGEKYELIAGERRWRAAQLAGVMKIPAVVRTVGEDRILELALVENIQRKDLNPMEEAKAYDLLLTQMKLSQADIAQRVGRDRSTIANSLRLLKLPERLQRMLQSGTLSFGHAKAIMAISDAETQIRVAEEVLLRLMSVRQTEAYVNRWLEKPEPAVAAEVTAGQGAEDPNVRAAEAKLRELLGTKVRIVRKGARGRIEIEFYSDEELDRLYTVIMERGH